MRLNGPAITYAGIAAALAGFVLIAITWGRVAALESVALQLPYVVSGGLTGLGLIVVGATAVNIEAKRRDAAQRERQVQQMADILRQVVAVTTGGSSTAGESHTEEIEWRR